MQTVTNDTMNRSITLTRPDLDRLSNLLGFVRGLPEVAPEDLAYNARRLSQYVPPDIAQRLIDEIERQLLAQEGTHGQE